MLACFVLFCFASEISPNSYVKNHIPESASLVGGSMLWTTKKRLMFITGNSFRKGEYQRDICETVKFTKSCHSATYTLCKTLILKVHFSKKYLANHAHLFRAKIANEAKHAGKDPLTEVCRASNFDLNRI